jgi:DNA repair protein RadC
MKIFQKTINEYKLKKIRTDIPSAQLKSSSDVANYAKQFYFDDLEIYESMFIILLNRNNNVEGYVKISQGGTAGTVVDTKLILKYAVDSLAHSVILVHNHPSGNVKPSDADRNITNKTKTALSFIDIMILDHVIITTDSHFSFSDEGII